MMNHRPASLPRDDAMREADLVLDGYTVSSRGRCMTRIGAAFVMRDGARRCVRVPVASTDAVVLGAMWADFGRSAGEMGDTPGTSDTAWRATAHPEDAAVVLQGYTANTRGVCLARVVGHYVARDGVRRCIRFLVDTVDPVKLGAAWAAFSGAAGWVRAASGVRVETLNQPVGHWADTGEERRATG
jgi:hypothetical protein